MRQLIVGDIHGCFDEFLELLDKAALASDDEIIAIGDVVDRGPESAKTLNFFRTQPHARLLLGNHERKHVRSFKGEIPPAPSQIITRHQLGVSDYPAACAFMESLPRYIQLADALLVHAFWEPGVPLTEQRDVVIVGTLTGEQYLKDKGYWPWYEQYDGDLPLIVGHRDYSGQMKATVYKDRVYGLDSRCVYGGSLSGLLLPDFKLISVRSRGDHWNIVQRRYADLIPPAPEDEPEV
ncbi:MAG TPA: metallophosphoesterase [Phototrophicaceae bacterium]|nr:metallophosphoesterase [Phototrophicaceae bacterium]